MEVVRRKWLNFSKISDCFLTLRNVVSINSYFGVSRIGPKYFSRLVVIIHSGRILSLIRKHNRLPILVHVERDDIGTDWVQ